MDFKDTLLLPSTSFAMRGDLAKNEPIRYKAWQDANIYNTMKNNRQGKTLFTLHDGPPYANGHLHIGHALNKILKDIIVKFNYFNGRKSLFTPGWDCHGLPIEQEIEKAIGKDKKDAMAKKDVRELCREHASKFVGIQRDEFKNMGVVADWAKPYVTMDFKFEANIYSALCEVTKQGLLIERSKPVYWSWAARTALAEAEVEYKDKEDYSLFLGFQLSSEALQKIGANNAKVVIWTTTPWTLPANVGISLNPHEDYVLDSDGYVVAEKLHENLVKQGILKGSVVKTFSSKVLENEFAINPLNGRKSHIVLGEHVLMENGTGCVHTAPGHGEDDYRVGLKYNLEVLMPVDENGLYDSSVVKDGLLPNPEGFVGTHILKANDIIVELLADKIVHVSKFVHSYPHCWRTNKPVIYRATKQWFIAMDEPKKSTGKTLRQTALEAIESVNFYPATGRNRLKTMIENRPDWCISRQRDWGVPIAFLRHKESGESLLDERVLNIAVELFEREGADAWYERPVADFLPYSMKTKADEYEKVTDILDVWFDSGSTFFSVLQSGEYEAGDVPADIYLEGSDQHRGWFQSSLLLSCALRDAAPYKSVVTHGFTVDQSGQKMSKSKGNVVAPEKVLREHGSEILRLWVAMSDFSDDIKISEEILKQNGELYRKLRNTFRFLLANINDLESICDASEFGELEKWILNEAKAVFDEVHDEFARFEYAKGMSRLNGFVVGKLSNIYLDITKDRLYCDKKDGKDRRSAQGAMALIARSLLTLVAPILTYTCDEIVENLPIVLKGDKKTIFDFEHIELESYESSFDDEFFTEARAKFSEIVDELKKSGEIKSTLELSISTNSRKIANLNQKDLTDWFLVSEVVNGVNGIREFEIGGEKLFVGKSNKYKCPRCWKLTSKADNVLCPRCAEVLA